MRSRLFAALILSATPVFAAVVPTPTAVNTPAATASEAATWTNAAFQKVMAESGRPLKLSDAQFQTLQENRKTAAGNVREYLQLHFKKDDPKLVQAFADLPREYYQWNYRHKSSFADTTYEWPSRPFAIGFGSFISDYAGQAYMIHLAHPKPGDLALEVGTGSGYNISLLSKLVKRAYSIEILDPIGTPVRRIFKPLGLNNVETRVGDGYFGWPEVKEGFDLIIVTCAAQYVPPTLLAQLKPKGRMVIPIGPPARGKQVLYVYRKDAQGRVHSRKDMGVFFIPMTGQMLKQATPEPTPAAGTPVEPAVDAPAEPAPTPTKTKK